MDMSLAEILCALVDLCLRRYHSPLPSENEEEESDSESSSDESSDGWFNEESVGGDPELRQRIKNNDPSLDKLAIRTVRVGDYSKQTYMPSTAYAWKADGIAIGKNTYIKRIKLGVPEKVETESFRFFCEGLAHNSSIEYMYISYIPYYIH